MTNLELLAKLQGITLTDLAEKIGCDRGNLRSSLQGKRPTPEDIKSRLYKILGVTEHGRLKTKSVHVWHIISTGVRLNNLDDMREALDRLTFEKFIGPTWTSPGESGEPVQITVLSCTAENGRIDRELGPLHEPLFICLVQSKNNAVDINPNLLSKEGQPLCSYLENVPHKETVPAYVFQRVLSNRAEFEEIEHRVDSPDYTWDKVIQLAKQKMTAAQAAELLSVIDLFATESQDDEPSF